MLTNSAIYPVCQKTEILIPADKRLLTSIIVVAWDLNRIQRQITSACLGNISKYTDREDYEFIFIDQCNKKENLDNRHNVIDIDKYIKLANNIGMSAAMNLGYKNSNSDYKYICFMHNDVFVPDNWLKKMVEIAEKTGQAVMPCQGHIDRNYVKKAYIEESFRSNDDAGMILMTKEAFKKTGGWDERFKTIYQDVPMRMRIGSFVCTNQVIITHIGAVSYSVSEEVENEAYTREGPIFNDLRDKGTGKEINYL